jgi:3-deoxy-D-manno-octulosonate 8-phosphate phosphatase KdsC-like HAD superfamily phosphatase
MIDLQPLLRRVRLVVFDFDGVFTDNRVWVNEQGEEMLAFRAATASACAGSTRSASTT